MPRWLGSRSTSGERYFYNTTFVRGRPGVNTPEEIKVVKSGSLADRHIKVVCRKCNNGWMSNKLENRVKDLVLALADGEARQISLDEQKLLAAWVAKTTMTNEHFPGGVVTVPQRERTHLMKNVTAPDHWVVLIGNYSGKFFHLNPGVYVASIVMDKFQVGNILYQRPRSKVLPKGTQSHVQSITFAVDKLILHAVNNSSPFSFQYPCSVAGEDGTRIIWPPQREVIDWPPAGVLSEENAVALMHRLYSTLLALGIGLPDLPFAP